MRVDVLQEDIDKAIAHRNKRPDDGISSYCPVVQALRRMTGEPWRAGTQFASVEVAQKQIEFPREAKAVTGLNSWQWESVRPFSFETVPGEWLGTPLL